MPEHGTSRRERFATLILPHMEERREHGTDCRTEAPRKISVPMIAVSRCRWPHFVQTQDFLLAFRSRDDADSHSLRHAPVQRERGIEGEEEGRGPADSHSRRSTSIEMARSRRRTNPRSERYTLCAPLVDVIWTLVEHMYDVRVGQSFL